MGINMVKLTQKTTEMEVDEESLRQEEYNKMAYPKQEEGLVEFLQRCQRKRLEVMLCPRCNSVFDRKVMENLEGVRHAKKGRNWRDSKNSQCSNGIWDPIRGSQKGLPLQEHRPSTYKPTTEGPKDSWTKPVRGRGQGHQKWKNFDVKKGSSIAYRKQFQASKQVAYRSQNYKGKTQCPDPNGEGDNDKGKPKEKLQNGRSLNQQQHDTKAGKKGKEVG